jgi:hypothetical protein
MLDNRIRQIAEDVKMPPRLVQILDQSEKGISDAVKHQLSHIAEHAQIMHSVGRDQIVKNELLLYRAVYGKARDSGLIDPCQPVHRNILSLEEAVNIDSANIGI